MSIFDQDREAYEEALRELEEYTEYSRKKYQGTAAKEKITKEPKKLGDILAQYSSGSSKSSGEPKTYEEKSKTTMREIEKQKTGGSTDHRTHKKTTVSQKVLKKGTVGGEKERAWEALANQFPKTIQHERDSGRKEWEIRQSLEWTIESIDVLADAVMNKTTPLEFGNIKVKYNIGEYNTADGIIYVPVYNNAREIVDFFQPDASDYPNEVARHLDVSKGYIYENHQQLERLYWKNIEQWCSDDDTISNYYVTTGAFFIHKPGPDSLKKAVREIMDEFEEYFNKRNIPAEIKKPQTFSEQEFPAGCGFALIMVAIFLAVIIAFLI